MTYFWRTGVMVVVAAAAAVIAAAPGSASTPTAFTGSFTTPSAVITGFRQADGNTFISVTDYPVFTGELAGTGVEHISEVIHPDGVFTFTGEDVCTCRLAASGLSGTIALPFAGHGKANGSTIGRFTIGDGTGGLANMRGFGTFVSSDFGSSGSFSGVYHFDP
jgi:hypothetical protein